MPLDPKSILVPPDRQRQNTKDLDGLKQSIKSLGRLIHPITLRRDGEIPTLVAGGRRLQSVIELGMELADSDFQFWEDLSPAQAKVIELEENVKRQDLTWRETTAAYAGIHKFKLAEDPSWSVQKTADYVNLHVTGIYKYLTVFNKLDLPAIRDAQSFEQAYGILQRIAERETVSIVNTLSATAASAFTPKTGLDSDEIHSDDLDVLSSPDAVTTGEAAPMGGREDPQHSAISPTRPQPIVPIDTSPVVQADFLTWARDYSGPKFTFIHCDFPYGVEFENYGNSGTLSTGEGNFYHSRESNYTELLDSFIEHFPKFASYSCHVMFWFSMTFYEITKRKLESTGLWVHEHPIVWYKSDNSGIIPGGGTAQHLRRVYETAFLCSLGKRPVVKSIPNCYAAPPQPNPIHPSHKSEPMLRNFFRAIVDSTTDMLDPTCGSAGALVAAEDCGARAVLGLESNPDYARAANAHVLQSRTMRSRAGG